MIVSVRGVEHTGMKVRDTEKLAKWYREVFGAREVSRSEGESPIIFLSFGRASLLELIPGGDGVDNTVDSDDRVHLCFAVEDLESALQGLADRGIELEKPVFQAYDGSSVAFFRDVEGHVLQFVQRIPGSAVSAAAFGE